MKKKIISSLLICTFLNLFGCYPYKTITKDELVQAEEHTDLQVITTNQYTYEFNEGNYTISEDSIYGSGKLKLIKGKEVKKDYEGSILFEDIEELKMDKFDATTTILAVAIPIGVFFILGFAIIESDTGTDEGAFF